MMHKHNNHKQKKEINLSHEELNFLYETFGLTVEDIENMDKHAWTEIREKCFFIEADEFDENDMCTERGELAADIASVKFSNLFSQISSKSLHLKVKYNGESDPLALLNGKIYDVISIENTWYRIVDETGEDYLYPPEAFEIMGDD